MGLNDINAGRFNGILHKILNIADGAPSPKVATEIFPTINLESDRPEWLFLGGERLISGYLGYTPTAGQYGHIVLTCPAGSNVVATIERIRIYNAAAGARTFQIAPWGVGTPGTPTNTYVFTRDSRWISASGNWGQSALNMGTFSNAAPQGSINKQINLATLDAYDIVTPYVIAPAGGILIRAGSADTPITVNIDWRERYMNPIETR